MKIICLKVKKEEFIIYVYVNPIYRRREHSTWWKSFVVVKEKRRNWIFSIFLNDRWGIKGVNYRKSVWNILNKHKREFNSAKCFLLLSLYIYFSSQELYVYIYIGYCEGLKGWIATNLYNFSYSSLELTSIFFMIFYRSGGAGGRLAAPRMSLLGRPVNYRATRRDARYRRLQARVYNFLERPRGIYAVTYHMIV